MDLDVLMSVLFSPTTPFLAWGLLLLPFLIKRRGLAPLHVAIIAGLSGVAVIASPAIYAGVPADRHRWIFLGLCVLVLTVTSYFGKRLYDKNHS